jgi:hypothetical protein
LGGKVTGGVAFRFDFPANSLHGLLQFLLLVFRFGDFGDHAGVLGFQIFAGFLQRRDLLVQALDFAAGVFQIIFGFILDALEFELA